MLLSEVWPNDEIFLDEASLKDKISKAAMASAIGASLFGIGAGGYSVVNSGPTEPITHSSPSKPEISPQSSASGSDSVDQQATAPTNDEQPIRPVPGRSFSVQPGANPHQGFPDMLHRQSTAQSSERVQNFRQAIMPMIQRINTSILEERNHLISLRSKQSLTESDREWLENIANRYGVETNKPVRNIISDLMLRVDIIPANLALAQAALESGWGTSDLARQSNNLFGQKATRRHQDDQRITNTDNLSYRRYSSPEQSIRSYIHNLNTHYAYESLRQARAQLRRQRNNTADTIARELTRHLQAYSTNPQYQRELIRVMSMFSRRT